MSAPTVSSSVPSPKWKRGIRKVDDGWTARGPGIWSDEGFSSSDEDHEAVPVKLAQKKAFHVIRMERAESALKRAVLIEKAPFIVQKRRAAVYSRTALMRIRSRASPKPALHEHIAMNVARHESSAQATEGEDQPCVKKAQAKIFLRAIRDIRANA